MKRCTLRRRCSCWISRDGQRSPAPVILTPDQVNSFDAALGAASATGVKVAGIVEDTQAFQVVHDPTHPDADADGNVLMPNVKAEEEMVDLLTAARAYQANLAAVNVIRDMVAKALQIIEAGG